MSELAPPTDRGPAEEAAEPDEAEDAEDEDEDEAAPAPMPSEGNLAVPAMWLFATALCAGFLIAAVFLFFDLAAGDVPADQIARSVGYCVVFGALTTLHVVVALNLRWQRDWARKGVVALESGAIAFCVYVAASPFILGPDVPVLATWHGLLGIVLHSGVLTLVCTKAMREWCEGTQERPSPGGLGRSRLLR